MARRQPKMGRPREFQKGPMEHYAVRLPARAKRALLKEECAEHVREFTIQYLELAHPEHGPYRAPGEENMTLKYRIISTEGGNK